MNSLKKFVSSFVTLTTMVWSVGGALLFPGIAQAATLSPGDLIKASGPAVYYYAEDGKRYVFPNEKTYFSWYSDFSSVVTITDAELAAIMIGGNVTLRPGTKLVKITTDPKTYAVTGACAILHWIESEEIAKSLYGDSWNTRVVDVPDAFFVDYEVGSSVSSAVHPDGQVVYYADAPSTYYVVEGGVKRMLTAAGITANKIDTSMAVMTDIVYSDGSSVSGYEAGLGKVACESGEVVVNGSVNVALASDTPAGKTVPYNSASTPLAKFVLSAGSEAALVTGITFKRVGVGTSSDLEAVYLYDGNGNRLTTGRTVNSSENTVTYNGLNLSIPANSSQALVVTADFSASSPYGGQHAFEITNAASVVISGSGTVGGSFPARGNTFTVGTTAASTLTVEDGANPSNPTIGAQGAEIATFKLTAGTNDVEVRRITLLEAGDSEAKLSNFKLYQSDTLLATTADLSGKYGDQVVLNLDPTYVLAEGTTKIFTLKADVAGKSSKTIKTYVEEKTDIYAVDTLYGVGAAVNIDNYDGGTTSGNDFSTVTTEGGQLTVAFNGPTTGNIAKNAQDVRLYEFTLTSSDSDLDIRKIRFVASSSHDVLDMTDVKLINADTGTVLAGPTTLGSSAASSTSEIILTDSFPLDAGESLNLAFTADIANTTAVESSLVQLTLDDFVLGDIKIVDTNENLALADIVPNSDIAGNVFTVQASSLSAALAGTPASGTAVKSQTGIPTAGLVFTAGTESDAVIKSITLTGYASSTTPAGGAGDIAYFNTVVQSCSLYDGDTLLASKSPSSGVMSMSSLSVDVPAGTSKTLTVKCASNSVTATSYFAVGIAANSTDVTAEDNDGNTITLSGTVNTDAGLYQTVYAGGTLTIAAGTQPTATIVLGGSTKQLAQIKATAQYEDVRIDRVRVLSNTTAKNISSVMIEQDGVVLGSGVLSGTATSTDIAIPGGLVITKDTTTAIDVYAKLSDVTSGGVGGVDTGATIAGGLMFDIQSSPWTSSYADKYNVEAVGVASGARLYASASANVTGNTMVIRKAKPVIAKLASGSATLSTGTAADLYKFQMAPDADGGSVAWIQMAFTVSTSSAATLTSLDTFSFYKGSTKLTSNSEVWITDGAGRDLTSTTSLEATSTAGRTVIVRLASEEVVSGSGTVYTLRATPTLGTGDATVTTSFARDTGSTVTGYLVLEAGSTRMGLGSVTGTAGLLAAGTFLWSDQSDIPHSHSTGAAGVTSVSNDWTSDVLVDDMNESNTLTN